MKKSAVFLILIMSLSCGRWKTTRLKSDHLCLINSGNSVGNIMLKYDSDDILNISFNVFVSKNIYVADNILKRVQVIDKHCKPVLYIGDKKADYDDTDAKFSKFQFSIIDSIAVDSNRNMYIQNVIAPSQKSKELSGRDYGFLPSYIIVFDEKGNLLYTLGKSGAPDMPFTSIDNMFIDKSDRLFVLTKSYEMWSVYRFINKRRDYNVNFAESDFKDTDGDKTYSGRIEKVVPYQSGDNLLVSAAYYDNVNFKYRKIFIYSFSRQKIVNTAFVIPDPKNELFTIVDDKYIYLWDIDEKTIRFMICNLKGDVVNNMALRFPEANNAYDELKIDNDGHFYSYHTQKKGIDIFDWR